MFEGIAEIMYFVPEPLLNAQWYAQLFDSEITWLDNPEYFFIRVGNQEIWFHPWDEKMASGAAGQVAYWKVTDFDAVVARAIALGATIYRGPLDREDGYFMCQLKDPFGNLIGIFGVRSSKDD
ncbi:glyoxalase [Pseudanabaena biceps]|nr:glyoxalase [Pseudanabaena biceps]